MDRERWQRIEDLYHAAQALPPAARAPFLAAECGGDDSLRSEIESLIAQPDATWAGPARPAGNMDEEILGKRQENDIWTLDFARETPRRLTFGPAVDQFPVWTRDGRRVIYGSARDGPRNLYSQSRTTLEAWSA